MPRQTSQGGSSITTRHRALAIVFLVLSLLVVPLHAGQSGDTSRLLVRIDTSNVEKFGDANNDDAAWASATVDLSAFAGQTIRLLIETADASTASLVEAAVDDVKVIRQ
jgi:hypothetical protein